MMFADYSKLLQEKTDRAKCEEGLKVGEFAQRDLCELFCLIHGALILV